MTRAFYDALQEPFPPFSYLLLREGLENFPKKALNSRFSQIFSTFRLQRETEDFLSYAEDYFSLILQANQQREELIQTVDLTTYRNCLSLEEAVKNEGQHFRISHLSLARRFKEREIIIPETSYEREFDATRFLNDIAFHAYMDRINASSSSAPYTQEQTPPQNKVRNIRTAPNATYTKD